MTNIVNFPKKEKRPAPIPRQRVFYIGYWYVGPMLCQEVQNLYLKRKGMKNGFRYWSVITYGKYDESDTRTYSIEIEQCEENDVPDMLEAFDLGNEVTFSELADMGWRGRVMYSAPVKSIFHRCYDGLRFPDFVIPLKGCQFDGRKMGVQSGAAKARLEGKPVHTYTFFGSNNHSWVWMNLETFDGREIKAVPVKLKTDITETLQKNFLLQKHT